MSREATDLEQVRKQAKQHGAERGAQVGGCALDSHPCHGRPQLGVLRDPCAATKDSPQERSFAGGNGIICRGSRVESATTEVRRYRRSARRHLIPQEDADTSVCCAGRSQGVDDSHSQPGEPYAPCSSPSAQKLSSMVDSSMATTPRLQGTGYSSQAGFSPAAASAVAPDEAFLRALAGRPAGTASDN